MTRKYRWVIDIDHGEEGDPKYDATGTEGPSNPSNSRENEAQFRMFDDDGNLYYTGRIWGDYDGFEPLDDFGMPNAGAVGIQYRNDEGKWEYL